MSDKTNTSKEESLLTKKSASLLDQAKAKAEGFGTDFAKSAIETASQAVSSASDQLKEEAVNNLLTKAVTFADSNQVAKQASSALSGLADGQVPTVDQVKASVSAGTKGAPTHIASNDTPKVSQSTGGGARQNNPNSQAQSAASVTTTSESSESKVDKHANAKGKRDTKSEVARLAQLSSTAQPFSEALDPSAPLPGTTAAITSAVVQMLADDRKEDDLDPILEFFTSNNH